MDIRWCIRGRTGSRRREAASAPWEEVTQRGAPFVGLEPILLVDPNRAQFLPPRQTVATPRAAPAALRATRHVWRFLRVVIAVVLARQYNRQVQKRSRLSFTFSAREPPSVIWKENIALDENCCRCPRCGRRSSTFEKGSSAMRVETIVNEIHGSIFMRWET